jgi:flagellar hook-length control protein FliK
MQTTTVPIPTSIPLAGASSASAPAPKRANAAPGADAKQFSHALSRELGQRQHSAAPAAKPQGTSKEVAGTPAKAGDETADAADDAAAAAAIGPVTDMLALVASFNQPAGPTPAPATDSPAAGLSTQVAALAAELPSAAGKEPGVDADGATLTTLNAAGLTTPLPADGKDAASGKLKQPVDGAARFAMKITDGATAPDAKQNEPGLPSMLEAKVKPRADATPAHAPEAVLDAGVKPRADATPAHAREAVLDAAAVKEPAGALQPPITAPVQQASLAMAQAIGGAPVEHIAARVGTPGWDNQVGQKIIWMVAGKEQTASLTLNPPDMGPMHVVLSVTNDQATVTFTAAQPEVRQALEAAMPKLREMMGENGIALGNATVNAGTPDGRQAQQGEQQRGQATGTRFGNTSPDAAPISLAPARQGTSSGSGMVDTFA